MTERVLLFGGSGQLGEQVRQRWTDCEVIAPSSHDVDVRKQSDIAGAFDAARPDLVLNCAAYNDLAGAEKNPQDALLTNALAVFFMALESERRNIAFMTISTDYVFDGKLGRPYVETDTPNPLSAYGFSKYCGELFALGANTSAYVVRTCGLYGLHQSSSKGYTFIDRILRQAESSEELRVVNDQIVSPTYAGHLASALRTLAQLRPDPGIYHAVNDGAVSWYDFAREALRQSGLNAKISAISTGALASAVSRPAFSALENAKLAAIGVTLPRWSDGIAAYLHDKQASHAPGSNRK